MKLQWDSEKAAANGGCRSVSALPARITVPGRYCLAKDMPFSGRRPAVTIAADDVSLDLQGFTLARAPKVEASESVGVQARGRRDVTIRNGRIHGFAWAVSLEGPSGGSHLIEGLQATGAIAVAGSANVVRGNHVVAGVGKQKPDHGIRMTGPLARLLWNTVRAPDAGKDFTPIVLDQADGAVVEGNHARVRRGSPGLPAAGIRILSGDDVLVVGNEVPGGEGGVVFSSGSGKARDNGPARAESTPQDSERQQ